MLVKLIQPVLEFDLLRKEVLDTIERVGNNQNQIMCQTHTDGIEDWQNGVGKLSGLEHSKEEDYKFIQPSLKSSYIAAFIKQFRGFRTRIMIMPTHHCYSIHYDLTPRIHIPIMTNSQSWMIWPFENSCNRLETGNIYWTDTTKHHTFINGSEAARIHLVICVNS